MSSFLIEIEKRLGKRIEAEEGWLDIKVPALLSKAGQNELKKTRDALQEEFLDNCLMETHDMRVLIRALNMIEQKAGVDVRHYVTAAANERSIAQEIQDELNARAVAEAEKRAKALKSDKRQGELEGQLKIPFDDGSKAEVASDLKVNKMPATVEALHDSIEAMIGLLQLSVAEIDSFWIKSGFDASKPETEQIGAFQFVWMALAELAAIRAESAAKDAVPPTAEETAEAEQAVIREISGPTPGMLMIEDQSNRPVEAEVTDVTPVEVVGERGPLVVSEIPYSDLVAALTEDERNEIQALVDENETGTAEDIVYDRFNQAFFGSDMKLVEKLDVVCGFLAEFAKRSRDGMTAPATTAGDEVGIDPIVHTTLDGPQTVYKSLSEVIADINARQEYLNLPQDDFDQIYTDAGYNVEESDAVCAQKASTVLSRMMAMKKGKKLNAAKKKAPVAPTEEPETNVKELKKKK